MEPSFNRLYVKHLLLTAAGALPLALIWNVENRWIAMPIGILSIGFILVQLHIIKGIADAQFAYSRIKRAEDDAYLPIAPPASALNQKWVYHSFEIGVAVLAMFIPVTGKKVENYLDWQPLLIDLLKLIWIPFVTAWWYHKRWKVVFENKEKEDYVQLYSFLIPLLLLFHSLVWYNQLQPSPIIATERMIVDDTGSNILYGNKYIFLTIEGRRVRFELTDTQYMQIRPADTVTVTVKEGALGYHYINSFAVDPQREKKGF